LKFYPTKILKRSREFSESPRYAGPKNTLQNMNIFIKTNKLCSKPAIQRRLYVLYILIMSVKPEKLPEKIIAGSGSPFSSDLWL
jgi:hypothetical protein